MNTESLELPRGFKSRFSPLTLRRWKSFFRQKRAWIGLLGFGSVFFFSMSAEIWSNSKPLYLKRDGAIYFPVFSVFLR